VLPASASVERKAAAPVEALDRGETPQAPAVRQPAAGSGKASKDAIEEEIRRFEEGE